MSRNRVCEVCDEPLFGGARECGNCGAVDGFALAGYGDGIGRLSSDFEDVEAWDSVPKIEVARGWRDWEKW